jgi:hypothetical protein
MPETSTSISDLPCINVQNTVTTNNNPQMSQSFQHKLQQAQQQQQQQPPPHQQPHQQQHIQQQQQQQQQQQPYNQQQQQQQTIPMSQETNTQSSFHSIINSLDNSNTTKLHSRDIPQFTNHITTDAESTPNYIPKTNQHNDFIEEDNYNYMYKDNQSKTFVQKINVLDMFIEKLHVVIVSVLLYLIFSLPQINTFMKKISNNFFTVEGNLSFVGISVKSILFGIMFTICNQAVDYMNI